MARGLSNQTVGVTSMILYVKSFLINDTFLTRLLTGYKQRQQAIRSYLWKGEYVHIIYRHAHELYVYHNIWIKLDANSRQSEAILERGEYINIIYRHAHILYIIITSRKNLDWKYKHKIAMAYERFHNKWPNMVSPCIYSVWWFWRLNINCTWRIRK